MKTMLKLRCRSQFILANYPDKRSDQESVTRDFEENHHIIGFLQCLFAKWQAVGF